MAIQMRRGEYKDLNTEKLLPAEWAVVLSGDPKAKDGKAAYLCFKAGDVKRMATYEDMEENIEEATGVIAEKAAEKAASSVTEKAEEKINDATKRADQSASKAEGAAKKVDDGLGAYQDKLNNTVKEYDKRLDAGITECKNILNSVSENFKQSVDFNAEQGSYWYVNSNRTITKYGPSSEYLSYASTVIPVTEGEVYEVHCAKKVADSYYVPGPVIAVSSATNSAADGTITILENPTDGNDQYVLTVPAGAKYLLVNHVVKDYSGIDMEIYKRNSLEDIVMGAVKGMFSGASAHNAIYRGRKLGNALTSEMLAGIRDGSFSDLYVGDYIETEDNIYRFMDFDYFLGCVSGVSGGKIEKHHAVLVPDRVMGSSAIDNYPEATQPKETHMYVNKLPEITQTLKGIFGNDNVAMMDRIIPKTANGEPAGWDWVNVGADLLTEEMVMGHGSWGQWPGIQIGVLKGQLAGFRYSHFLMCSNDDYWLRNKRTATNYALISSGGISSSDVGNLQHGVRPFFVIW